MAIDGQIITDLIDSMIGDEEKFMKSLAHVYAKDPAFAVCLLRRYGDLRIKIAARATIGGLAATVRRMFGEA